MTDQEEAGEECLSHHLWDHYHLCGSLLSGRADRGFRMNPEVYFRIGTLNEVETSAKGKSRKKEFYDITRLK
jgi:hypothetical protein